MNNKSFRLLGLNMKRPMVATAVGLCLLAGGYAVAQQVPMEAVQWDKRRLDQLDRNVRRLERALTQRNAAGQPVIVEPDPEVITLQGQVQILERRLSDLEATFQRVNGDTERLTFQLDEATRDNAAMRRRLQDVEGRMERQEKAAQEAAELNAPITAHSPTGDAGQDLTAATRLLASDAARGERALLTLIMTWPDTPQAREANVRLADFYVASEDTAAAVPYYAAALKDWPRQPWAAKATLDLADALRAGDRNTQACGALNEFTRRYAETASAALKTRATQARTRARCS